MSTFEIEVWADNWMAVYVDGQLIGEDSVPITTERSFNAEVFAFEASYPFTVAIEAKDFKETDSGLEYIGEANQQMGDGGVIAQITDTATTTRSRGTTPPCWCGAQTSKSTTRCCFARPSPVELRLSPDR